MDYLSRGPVHSRFFVTEKGFLSNRKYLLTLGEKTIQLTQLPYKRENCILIDYKNIISLQFILKNDTQFSLQYCKILSEVKNKEITLNLYCQCRERLFSEFFRLKTIYYKQIYKLKDENEKKCMKAWFEYDEYLGIYQEAELEPKETYLDV